MYRYGLRLVTVAVMMCALLVGIVPHVSAANPPIVVSNTNDSGMGSLRAAISLANSTPGTDTINFTIGTGAQTITLLSPLPAITEDLTIAGDTQPVYTTVPLITVDGNGNNIETIHGTIFTVTSGTVLINALIIQNGKVSGSSGGGIFNQGTLTVQNSTVTANTATDISGVGGIGGGIANTGTLTLTNTTVSNNTAMTTFNTSLGGGGIDNSGGGHVTLNNSTVTGNIAAGSGGGIHNAGAGSLVTIQTNSTFTTNHANGSGSAGGGAIYNHLGGQAIIDSSTIGGTGSSGNTANNGGGIFNTGAGSLLTIRNNSTIFGNVASGTGSNGGGGIYNDTDSTVTVTNSTIGGAASSGNMAANGGGILSLGDAATTSVTLTGSSVVGNQANGASGGGGIANYSGTLALIDSTVDSNTATGTPSGENGAGGGIYNNDVLTITRSTISRNSATNLGGGIANLFNATLHATNSTISGNSAAAGGGIDNLGSSVVLSFSTVFSSSATGIDSSDLTDGMGGILQPGHVTLLGTLLANSGGNCVNQIANFSSTNYNLSSDATCNAALTGSGDLKGLSPLLGPLTNNGGTTQTHALLANSPAFDRVPATMAAGCPATDQRNTARPQPAGGLCDIGAFEGTTSVTPTVTSVAPNAGPIGVTIPNVVITGTNFRTGATVLFGANPATNVVVNSDTQITVTAPSGASPGTVDVTVKNPGGLSGVKSNAFTYVIAQTITLTPTTLPIGTKGVPYSQQISASGGTAPYTFSLTNGPLPNGLLLLDTGLLSGTPTQTGSFPITITATDANAALGTQSYTLVIGPAAIVTIAVTPSPFIKVGETVQLHATAIFSDGTQQDITNSVTWTSSDTHILTVDNTGKVLGVGPGTATVTATAPAATGTKQAAAQGQTEITVIPASLIGIGVPPPASKPSGAAVGPPAAAPVPNGRSTGAPAGPAAPVPGR